MRRTLTFLHGFLDYPRGATVPLRDYAAYRDYRAGRAVAGRLRRRGRTGPSYLLGPDHFSQRRSGIADAAVPRPAAAAPSLIDAR